MHNWIVPFSELVLAALATLHAAFLFAVWSAFTNRDLACSCIDTLTVEELIAYCVARCTANGATYVLLLL